jgi:hypothetical protein
MPVVYGNGVHLTKLLYGKFVVAGAKLDEVDARCGYGILGAVMHHWAHRHHGMGMAA